MSAVTRIGLFGGTFNPVHHGHLRLALDLVETLALAEMRLLPCHLPAHRQEPAVSAARRAEMVRLAIAGEPALRLDTLELEREGPSYTVDTLQIVRRQVGAKVPLLWVLGADAYAGLERWKDWQQLLDYAHLVVVARPGWTLPQTGKLAAFAQRHALRLEEFKAQPAGGIMQLESRLLDISATQIRTKVAQGRSIRYLLPEPVHQYIAEHHLYRDEQTV